MKEQLKEKVKEMYLDFKPALTNEQLDARLLREFQELKNQPVINVIKGLLPALIIPIFINYFQ